MHQKLSRIIHKITGFWFFCVLALSPSLRANSGNPPNGHHGESQNSRSCHTGNLNNGDGSISIGKLPLGYTPSHTYDLALTIAGTNSRGYGFQLLSKANGSVSGSLTAVSSGMEIDSGAAEHRGTSSSGVWNFQWTAPSTDVGNVTFLHQVWPLEEVAETTEILLHPIHQPAAFVNSTPPLLSIHGSVDYCGKSANWLHFRRI